jgi:hypothetical protein
MSAAAAVAPAARPAGTLELYRDDGPLARALGVTLGRALRLPAAILALLAALPVFVAIALEGSGASHALAAAVVAWAVLLGGASSGRPHDGRFRWAVPPLLRALDYAGLLWIASLASSGAVDGAFALLGALAFRHYDLVYRVRHQAAEPPAWVGVVAGGWEGRLIAGCVLLSAGALPAGFFVAAALLGALFVGESAASWRRFMAGTNRVEFEEDEEDEGQ